MPVKKKPEAEKENAERWLLTYSDMITLLLALFVVLYATSKSDPVKFQTVALSLQRAFNVPVLQAAAGNSLITIGGQPTAFVGLTSVGATIGPELVSYAQREQLGDQVSVTASRDAVVISLGGALTFGSGSAELRPEARGALELIANTIRSLPDHNPVRVEGHTDSAPPLTGRFPTNWELSAARAGAAARFLAEAGVAPDRITAVGYADTKPIGDNETPEGKTRNRRVEIWILNPEPIGPTAVAPRTSAR
ncbi:MAG TPA: OmpA family protein [Chloroflexota bacterium]|nr:OmpA family protein [Chloroflexota bacterium]